LVQLSDNITTYLASRFGEAYLRNYEEYINSETSMYVRFPLRENSSGLIERLAKYGIKLEQVPHFPFAYKVLEGREKVGKTVEYVLGKYYIQSLSSMIPPLVLNPAENDVTLDLCAAPGSKTTELSDLMNNKGTLYANESNLDRLKTLVYNLDRMNLVNLGVIRHRGEKLSKVFDAYFDKVLVDAPCSALGIIQKKNEVTGWWKLSQAEKLAELQLRLLISAIKMTKVGGEIVYSTCTLTLEENELVVNTILKKYPVELVEIELPVKSQPGFTNYGEEPLNPELRKTHRIVPWESGSEGFFICKLRKIDETEKMGKTPFKKKNFNFVTADNKKVRKYLLNLSGRFNIDVEIFKNYKYWIKQNDIYFVSSDWTTKNEDAFLRIGTRLGNIDKKDEAHINTLGAQILGGEIYDNIVEIDTNEIKIYLRGGTIRNVHEPLGQKVIKYEGMIVGTAIAFKDGLKSQFPRFLRTQEVVFHE